MSSTITLDNFQPIFAQLLAPHVIITEERAAFFQQAFPNKLDLLYHLDFDGSAIRFANHAIAKIREIDCAGLSAILDVLSTYYGESSPVQADIEALQGVVAFLCEIPSSPYGERGLGTQRESTGRTKLYCNIPTLSRLSNRQSQLNVLNDWYWEDLGNPVMLLQGGEGAGKTSLAWSWQTDLAQSEESPSIIYWWQFNERHGIHELIGDFTQTLKAPLDHSDLLTPNRMLVPRLINHFSRLKSLLLILDDFDTLLHGALEWALFAKREGAWPAWKRECLDPTSELLLDLVLHPEISIKTLIICHQVPAPLQPNGYLRAGVRQYALNSGLGLHRVQEIFEESGLSDYVDDVEKLCEPVRYYPLSVRLLTGYLSYLPSPHTDIFTRQDRDVVANQTKVIDLAWRYLSRDQRELLAQMAVLGGRVTLDELALFLSYEWDETDQDHPEIMLASDEPIEEIEQRMRILITRGFVNEADELGRFGLHSDLKAFVLNKVSEGENRKKHHILAHYYEIKNEAMPDFHARMAHFYHLIESGDCQLAFAFYGDAIQSAILYEDLPEPSLAEINLLEAFLPSGPAGGCLQDLGDRLGVLNNLGILYIDIGLLTQASEYLEEYLDILMSTPALLTDAEIDHWEASYPLIGNFLIPTGRFRDGLAFLSWRYEQIYAGYASEDLPVDAHYFKSIELTQKGRIFAYAGRYDEADVAFQAALDAFQRYQAGETKNVYPLLTLGYLCEFLLLVNKTENALKLIIEGMPDQHGRRKSIRDHLNELKHYLETRADDQMDGRTLFAELEILEREIIKIDWLLGWGYTKLGEFEKARHYLDTAEKEGDRVKAYDLLPSIMLAQARLKMMEIDIEASFTELVKEIHLDLDKGERIAMRAGQIPTLADLYNLRAALFIGEMDFSNARATAEAARRFAFRCDLPTKYQAYATQNGRFVYRSFSESEEIIERVDQLEKML